MKAILVKSISFSKKYGKSGFPSFFRKLCLSLLLSSFFLCAYSNNIRIDEVVRVSEGAHPDSLFLSFSLRWENSWRDEFNWDAAWIFLKYKVGQGGWQHVNLGSSGHTFTGEGAPYTYMTGKTGSDVVGLFVFRATNSTGPVSVECKVSCAKSALGGKSLADFENNEAFVLAQGIEMVYIPYGAYALGDGMCGDRFAGSDDGSPAIIDSEEALSNTTATKIYTVWGGSVSPAAIPVAAGYPKGYNGFYLMKYEVSQEQYVMFLNNLTYTQQQERVPGLASFSKGDYIFGDASRPSCRNGIIVAALSEDGSPVLFANNLNNDGKYSQADDGKTVACNYLSPEDMITYLSWSGLRPMSELEYEKACRALYPEMPQGREYAWHENIGVNALTAILSSGERTEKSGTVGANVNAGNRFTGPVRCGLFATSSSTQRDAGASFWGVMEMSGNLRELCYNIGASGFDGNTLGDGTYNKFRWSIVVSYFSVRGGGFSSVDSLLRVSDRSEAENYFTFLTQQDSTVGFRGVRPVSEPVNPGSLIVRKEDGSAMNYGCLGATSHIESATAASVDIPGMSFSYLWYVMEPGSTLWTLLTGETGETLDYQDFVNNGTSNVTYQFKRKAICQVGEATSAVFSLTVPNTQIKAAPPLVYLDGANAASSVITVTPTQTGGSFSWFYDNTAIVDGTNIINSAGNSVYRPSRTHFGDKKLVEGQKPVIWRYTIGECSVDSVVVVNVAAYDTRPCIGTIKDAENHNYAITKIGDQCWMQKNMNIGEMSEINGESTFWRYDEPGIQKFCSGGAGNGSKISNIASCEKYGGLYEWWEVVCAGHCPGLTTPNMEIKQGDYITVELAVKAAVPDIVMAPDGYHIKGFCPDGWHLPSDEEWKQLEMSLGMSRAQADMISGKSSLVDGFGRQTGSPGQGQLMKSAEDNWNGLSTKSNSDERYRFYGRPHGYRTLNGGGFDNINIQCISWSSTPDASGVWNRQLMKNYTSVCRHADERSRGFSVRCVRD